MWWRPNERLQRLKFAIKSDVLSKNMIDMESKNGNMETLKFTYAGLKDLVCDPKDLVDW